MSTPHNSAKKSDIEKIVLMPGDPLRAKYLAQKYLSNVKCFNTIRNMFGYSGDYKGRRISIMGSGMGMPSIGIYSYELFTVYDVDVIIRIGSCGSYVENLKLYDVVLVEESYTQSTYAKVQNNATYTNLKASKCVNEKLQEVAKKIGVDLHCAKVHCSDVFYKEENDFEKVVAKQGCQAVEMESFALFHNALVCQKQAACLLSVSDSLLTKQETSAKERECAFHAMMEVALGYIHD